MGTKTGKGLAKRRRLFRIGARAWARYFRLEEDRYACPICGRDFPCGAADDGTLSLEHVPPKSAGGRALVLTCRRCNSEAGQSIDSAEARRQDMDAVFDILLDGKEETLPRHAQMTVGESIIPIEISRFEGTTLLRPVASASNPKALQHVVDFFSDRARHGTGDSEEFTITVSRKDFHRLAKISDLKAGFLAAFAFFGYRFALHPNLEPVRRQILEPNLNIIDTCFHGSFTSASAMPFTLVAVTEPVSCIAAILGNRGVLMPEPHGSGDLYDMLAGWDKRDFSFRGMTLGWPNTLELRWDRARSAGRKG